MTVDPSIPVKEIAKFMRERSISSVILFRDDKPIGLVTERDLVRRVLSLGKDPDTTEAYDVCSKPVNIGS